MASQTTSSSAATTPPALFQPLTIRGLTFPNRIFVSPMCQYSSTDGFANTWHVQHIGSRAIGRPGLIIVEATAVTPEGRISKDDLGLWKDEQIPKLKEITDFVHSQKTLIGIQIAHAGRKASMSRPWDGYKALDSNKEGWEVVAPSEVAFDEKHKKPHQLSIEDIHVIQDKFVETAVRAVKAGFDVIELHGAHGYLIHEFYSHKSNLRTDEYGGSFENRIKFLVEIVQKVRQVIPKEMPLFVRISATDFVEDGWNVEDSIKLSKVLKDNEVDLIDVSGGGNVVTQQIALKPGYQTPFATTIKEGAGILTGAVGLIVDPVQANEIIESKKADAVLLAREFLREPYWPIKAAKALGYKGLDLPPQYARAIAL